MLLFFCLFALSLDSPAAGHRYEYVHVGQRIAVFERLLTIKPTVQFKLNVQFSFAVRSQWCIKTCSGGLSFFGELAVAMSFWFG